MLPLDQGGAPDELVMNHLTWSLVHGLKVLDYVITAGPKKTVSSQEVDKTTA